MTTLDDALTGESSSAGNFLGYLAVMSAAVFSFAGVESVAMAAAETRYVTVPLCNRQLLGLHHD